MTSPTPAPALNLGQAAALASILQWLADRDARNDSPEPVRFYVLSGSAGTGKTFCVQELVRQFKGRVVFTAPTNKATKVLRTVLKRDDYTPECRTTYSLLGLKLEASGEVKKLREPEDPIDLKKFRLIVVDEASMVNAALFEYIVGAAERFRIPVLFLGDPAQLPPVGEARSPVWEIQERSHLTEVMRFKNQILDLATRIRDQVDKMIPKVSLASANSDDEGVWRCTGNQWALGIRKYVDEGLFHKPEEAKIIAWRNVTCLRYNEMVRRIWLGEAEAAHSQWVIGDRVIFTSPAGDLEDKPMASTDDEGLVTRVTENWHWKYPDFKCFVIDITLDQNAAVTAWVLHPSMKVEFERKTQDLATAARSAPRKWGEFWEFKEAFHELRHAYAITSHRTQGSTYRVAFVDWADILLNRNRQEAFRSLYVACSRPRQKLILV